MTFLKTDKLLVNKMNKMYNHTLGSKASFKVLTSLRFLGYDASYDIFHALEKEMATHSSVLAWRIPGTGEPGGLPSLGSHRVGHDWSDLAAAAWYLSNHRSSVNALEWISTLPWVGKQAGHICVLILSENQSGVRSYSSCTDKEGRLCLQHRQQLVCRLDLLLCFLGIWAAHCENAGPAHSRFGSQCSRRTGTPALAVYIRVSLHDTYNF